MRKADFSLPQRGPQSFILSCTTSRNLCTSEINPYAQGETYLSPNKASLQITFFNASRGRVYTLLKKTNSYNNSNNNSQQQPGQGFGEGGPGAAGKVVLGLWVTHEPGRQKGPQKPCLVGEIQPPPLFIQNKQMINCLISNCAGRHTTHVPAGGAAKRFILFNNKSKINVAFPPLPVRIGPPAGAGEWHPARAGGS